MRKIILSIVLVCFAVAAYCQSPRLVKREYYFDTDPGPGNGTVTLFTACDSIAESILSIPTTGLAVGSHTLYIRYADSTGVWGIAQPVAFAVSGTMPEVQAPKIVAREYFIDTDPGAGNGTSASFTASDSVSESILSISTSGLAGGPHALYIRYRDSVGKWGQCNAVFFTVTGMATPSENQSPRLVEGEYYVDTDPGAGNGTPILYAAADSLSDVITSIPTTGLAAGPHILYIRYADSAGKWSQPQTAAFAMSGYAGPTEASSPRLAKGEYFIDTDPGIGNGIPLAYAYADSIADTIADIATTGLVSGVHTLYIRYADSAGRWGTVQGANFAISGGAVAGETQAPRLRRREYFIDTDPGQGNGIGSIIPFADSVSDTISAISTAGLSTGGHLLYVRYADSAGNWGTAQSVGFAVSGTIAENASPRMRKREWFVDTDPGPGNGNVATISYSDSVSDAVAIATTGLPLGGHVAYLRYADSTGAWGQLQSFPFTVSTAVQQPPAPPLARREYFFDTDPGPGNGVVSTITVADSVNETLLSIPTTGLSIGYHILYIRYADTAGRWGQVQSALINITTIVSSSETQSPPIYKREYFIDTDPGPGNGVVSTFVFTDSVTETISSIPTAGLAQGSHMLFVRYQDSAGNWGMSQGVAFAVSGSAGIPETISPRLARREYFIDTDPGPGNGFGGSITYADSVTETISGISTTGLSAGTHFLFIRYADSAVQWSGVQSVSFNVTGTVATAPERQSAPLSKREYFIDTDPGLGNGVLTTFAAVDSVADTILFIPTVGLASGGHILYIRYADTSGNWGPLQSVIFTVNSALTVTERQSPRLYKREYYIDTDPGAGNGTVSTFAYADSVADTSLVVSTIGLDSGAHVLYVRYADSAGTWGVPQYVLFRVSGGALPEVQAPRIVKREYYIDADPGPGNGIVTMFAAADSLADTVLSISTTGLSVGSHVLYMRYADSAGRWGLSQSVLFNVINVTASAEVQSPKIRKREYYIDTDPGPGHGVVTTLTYSDSVSETIFSIPTDTLAVGAHVLYIRYADSTGKWGIAQSAVFNVISTTGMTETQSPKLVSGEYFIDTDPGQGAGTPLPSFAMADSAVTDLTIPTTGLATGYHRAYIRYKDSTGRWGLPISLPIDVCLPPIGLSPISAAAGMCQGATITVSDTATGGVWSSSNTAVATISAAGVVTGLTAGTTVLTYTKTNACGAAIVTHNLTVSNSLVTATTATPTVCAGTSAAINASGSTYYSWSPSTGLSSTTVASVSATPTVTTIYTITGTDIYGCSSSTTRQITVNPIPVLVVSPSPATVCLGSSRSLSVSGGVSYSWSPAVTFNNTAGSSVTMSPSVNTTYTVTGQSSTGCTGTVTVVANVLSMPVVSAIAGDTMLCAGSVGTLTDTASGGVWSSSATGIATVDGSGHWSAVAAGNAVISYTKANFCFSTTAVRPVRVNYNPAFTVSSVTAPCVGYAGSINLATADTSILDYTVDGGSINHVTISGPAYPLGLGLLTTMHSYVLMGVHTAYCSNTYNDTINVDPPAMAWVGGASGHTTDWNYAANWTCGFAPSVTDDVTIVPATYMPVISNDSTGSAHRLTLAAGAGIQAGNNAMLKISGNLVNAGVISGAGKVVLLGSGLQHISGKGTISNLEVKNVSGVQIDTASKLNISNTLYLTSGMLATNDSLELLSADTATAARIAPVAPGAGVSGKVIADQYIQGGYRRYRFWSHPFRDTISLGQVQQYLDITGSGGAANGFTTTTSNASSVFWFNPYVGNSAASYDPGWRPFTRINAAAADTNRFHPGQGIRLFFRGAKGEGLGYLGYYGMYTPSATIIKMKGNVNQGTVTIALKQGSSAATQSFNMVGNPYPSAVNIGDVLTNASATGQITGSAFYVWNPAIGAGGQYMAIPFGGGYNIQACAAFQVMADHDGATLTFHENDKVAHADVNLFRQASEMTTIGVYDSAGHLWDKLDIRISGNGSEGYDRRLDAIKPMSTDFSLYSISSDGQKLTIDDRPLSKDAVIPLGVHSSYAQQFRLRADNIAMPEEAELMLHDKLLARYVPFTQNTEYPFVVDADKNSQGDQRFELIMLRKLSDKAAVELDVWPNPVADDLTLTVRRGNGDEAARVVITDMNGVSVYAQDMAPGIYATAKVPMDKLAAGVYLVEARCGGSKVIKKIVKD
jgi:hypothetical protein